MENGTTAINDIVQQKAEEIAKSQEDTGTQDSQQQDLNTGAAAEPTEAEKEAATKLELEKTEAETAKLAEAEKIKSDATKELLKKFNVDSVEELEEKLGKSGEKNLTEEEQKKANELYEANLRKFAIEKDIMKGDDFDQLKTLKSKQDAELIFEDFKKDFIDENTKSLKEEDNTLTDSDIERLAKEEFEKEYKLNSTSEKQKQKGLNRLAKEAAEIRNPKVESYNEAKEQYDADTDVRTNFPKYVQGIEKIVTGIVPDKIEWFKTKDGEEDIPIEIDLPEEDRKEIIEKVTKRMQNPDTYKLFKEGKLEEIKERVEEYSEYLVNKKSKQLGNEKVAEIFLKRGVAQGSTTGAVNSFATQETKSANANQKLSESETKAAILNQPAFKPK